MQAKYSEDKGVGVFKISGRIDAQNSMELESTINSVLESGKLKILIDLNDVEYISSSGLRVMLSTLKYLDAHNGKLVLCSLKPFVKNIFFISGFTEIFLIHDSYQSALGAF